MITKEKLKQTGKEVLNALLVIIVVTAAYLIGKHSHKWFDSKEKKNPYSQVYSTNEVSIAVNESNDLLLITKKSGEYVVYSDSVGLAIFKLYASKMYSNINENVK